MNPQLNKVFSKLAKEKKTELASEKVELGLVDDIENKFKKGVSTFNKAKNDYLKSKSLLGQSLFIFEDDIEQDLKKIKKITKDLGLDLPSNIQKIEADSKAYLKEATKLLK